MQIERKNNQPKISHVTALINQSSLSINTTTSTPSMVLDPMLPAQESCSDDISNTIIGRRFLIPYRISDKNGLYKELIMMKCCVYTQ